jgi:hypothetical protein
MSIFKRNLLISPTIVLGLTIFALALIIMNIGAISDPYLNERIIDESTFEGQWSFAVKDVVIRCDIITVGLQLYDAK